MKESEFYIDFQYFLENYEMKSFSKEEYHFFLYRLIFLIFLEKSKLFNQNENILKATYDICSDLGIDFFQRIIKPIFFKLINNVEQEFPDCITCEHGIHTEFLGNIFDIEDLVEMDSSIFPIGFWDKYFDLVNKFNWNIDENVDNFEVITPKIYEYIYERDILESLKRKKNIFGTVFTPKHVIKRIIDNTLYPYLQDFLTKEKCNVKIKDVINSKQIAESSNISKLKSLFDYLPEIKIIDNACGGGAFIVEIKNELLKIYNCLYEILYANSKQVESKENFEPLKEIFEKNIFGVDLSNLVINLAKMRLALSYISYYLQKNEGKDQIKFNLSNLNKNFKHGNSLIGIKTKKDLSLLTKLRDATETLELREDFLDKLKNYFKNVNYNNKSENHVNKLQIIQGIDRKFTLKIADLKIDQTHYREMFPFHWIIEFPSVFYYSKEELKNPGFDIMIGNPPYGNILSDEEKAILKKEFTSLEGKKGSMNIASIFIEGSLKLLKKNGYLGYIVPNTISRKDEFSKIRNIILDNTYLFKIIDEGNPFKDSNVTLEMIDFIFKKEELDDYDIDVEIIRDDIVKRNRVSKKIFKKFDWFVFHYDPILEILNRNTNKLGYYGRFLSAKRPSKLKVEMKKGIGDIIAVKGSCIKPFFLKKDLKIEMNNNVEKYIANLKYPLIILPEVSNSTKASLCRKDCVPISGVVIWSPNEKARQIQFFNSYLLLLSNSKVFAFYFNKYIINRSYLTTHLDSTYLERLPVKPIKNVRIFLYLAKYLLFLNKDRSQNAKLILFYKNEIMNLIIYSLYFFESIKTYDLIRKLEDLIYFKFNNSDVEKLDDLKDLMKKLQENEEISKIFKLVKNQEDVRYIEKYIKENIKNY